MPDLSIETNYTGLIAGVDEAGRGPFAGPVVAAAVVVDQSKIIPGIKDSKKLSKTKREELYDQITENYLWAMALIEPQEIDEINILEATKKACIKAVAELTMQPQIVLVDGNMKFNDDRFISYVKGDDRSLSIAAASIVAKVTRDRIMGTLHNEFPHYGWVNNSGYGTKEHLAAIKQHGYSPYHRLSFKIRG